MDSYHTLEEGKQALLQSEIDASNFSKESETGCTIARYKIADEKLKLHFSLITSRSFFEKVIDCLPRIGKWLFSEYSENYEDLHSKRSIDLELWVQRFFASLYSGIECTISLTGVLPHGRKNTHYRFIIKSLPGESMPEEYEQATSLESQQLWEELKTSVVNSILRETGTSVNMYLTRWEPGSIIIRSKIFTCGDTSQLELPESVLSVIQKSFNNSEISKQMKLTCEKVSAEEEEKEQVEKEYTFTIISNEEAHEDELLHRISSLQHKVNMDNEETIAKLMPNNPTLLGETSASAASGQSAPSAQSVPSAPTPSLAQQLNTTTTPVAAMAFTTQTTMENTVYRIEVA